MMQTDSNISAIEILNDPAIWFKIYSYVPIPQQKPLSLICKNFYKLLSEYFPLDYSIDHNPKRQEWHKWCGYRSNRTRTDQQIINFVIEFYTRGPICNWDPVSLQCYQKRSRMHGHENDRDWELDAVGICKSMWPIVLHCVFKLTKDFSNEYHKASISYWSYDSGQEFDIIFQRLDYDHVNPCCCHKFSQIQEY